jgi:hypothetical protein
VVRTKVSRYSGVRNTFHNVAGSPNRRWKWVNHCNLSGNSLSLHGNGKYAKK